MSGTHERQPESQRRHWHPPTLTKEMLEAHAIAVQCGTCATSGVDYAIIPGCRDEEGGPYPGCC